MAPTSSGRHRLAHVDKVRLNLRRNIASSMNFFTQPLPLHHRGPGTIPALAPPRQEELKSHQRAEVQYSESPLQWKRLVIDCGHIVTLSRSAGLMDGTLVGSLATLT